jgi:hypothetical protein
MSRSANDLIEKRVQRAANAPQLNHGDIGRLSEELSMLSGYFATQASPTRGELYWPTMDSRKVMDRWARRELLKMSRALAENCGFAGGPLQTLSELVGWLKPQARSKDEAWNEEAEARFEEVTGTASQFDAAGIDNFASSQIRATYQRGLDGDFGTVFAKSIYDTFQIHNYEGSQIGRAIFTNDKEGWYDGVKLDRHGRAVRYALMHPDGVRPDKVIDAASFHLHINRRFQNAVRGTPVLSASLTDLIDIVDVDGFTKHGIKVASLFAFTREGTNGPQAITSPLQSAQLPTPQALHPAGLVPTTTATASTSTEFRPMGNFENAFSSGMVSSVPLKAIHDERPGPNVQAFKDYLLRKSATSIGVPAPILFLIDEPGGVWTRYLMERAADWILCQQIFHLLPYCRRVWNITIANEIQAGRLRKPSDPNWWRPSATKWVGKRKLTVDIGREGNLQIALKNALMSTYAQWYDSLGNDHDWQDSFRQAGEELDFARKIEQEKNLPAGWLTDRIRGVQTLPPETAPKVNDQQSGDVTPP